MKKYISILLVVFMAVSCLMLASCGGSDNGTAIVTTDEETTGSWTEKSDGVHVAAGDTDADFRDVDGNLVTDILGIEIVFEKQQ